jgi:hypothetical protein
MTFNNSSLERNSAASGDGIFHNGGITTAANSCLVANGVGFFNNTALEQDATFSWWGKPDGPGDADGLSGATGSGDGVTRLVDFSGFQVTIPAFCAGQIFADQFEDI